MRALFVKQFLWILRVSLMFILTIKHYFCICEVSVTQLPCVLTSVIMAVVKCLTWLLVLYFAPAPKHMIWLSADYRRYLKISIRLCKSLVGDTLLLFSKDTVKFINIILLQIFLFHKCCSFELENVFQFHKNFKQQVFRCGIIRNVSWEQSVYKNHFEGSFDTEDWVMTAEIQRCHYRNKLHFKIW